MKIFGGALSKLGSKFIDLFKKKGPEATEAMKDMAKDTVPMSKSIAQSIKIVGKAATVSAKGLIALGASIALVGLGIGAILFGMAELVKSFKDLAGEQIVGALGAIVVSLLGIAFAIPLLLNLLPALGVSAALAIIPLIGLSMVISSIAESLAETRPFVEAMGTLMAETSKVTPEAATAAKEVMVAATNLAKVEINAENVQLVKAIAALTAAAGGMTNAPAAAAAGNIEISLNMDGKEIYRKVKSLREDDLKGRFVV